MLNEVITKADTAQATADAALPKAGGTMTGQLVLDYNNTAAIIAKCASASAQIKLERTSTSTGAGYIGADDTNCLDVRDGSVVSRFFVDQSGRIKTPFQPCAIVKLDNDNSQGGQNSTIGPGGTNPSGSIIKFENIRRNTGSHYNASTGQFTCPVAGVYEVKFSSNINTSNGGFPAFPMIYRNGSLYLRAYDSISVSGWTQQAISAHIDCGAGDTLDIRLYVASGYMWADSDVDYTQVSFRFLG
jgi:hypothetical protein